MANPGRTEFPVLLFYFIFFTFAKIIILKIRGIRDIFAQILDVASLPRGI
jgi:hypothetical protein